MGKKKSAPTAFDALRAEILAFLVSGRAPAHLSDILRGLGVTKRSQKKVVDALRDLERDGEALRLSGGMFIAVKAMKRMRGTLEIQRGGMGFVLPETGAGPDVYVGPAHFNGAWNGDLVEVALLPGRHGKSPEGRVIRVLERPAAILAARVLKRLGAREVLAQPLDTRHTFYMLVDSASLNDRPGRGEILLVKAGERLEPDVWSGVAQENLGNEASPAVQERVTKVNHAVPTVFPPAALAEAAKLAADPAPAEFAGRRDMREMGFVTIDGAQARDFDDAVYVEPEQDGWRLWVAIADVSHYVQPGGGLDAAALARSNSYYFPRSVEPMLPEALSNGVCSLRPGVPRLAMVAEIRFYADGAPDESRFYPAVIQSQARLTYDAVSSALDGQKPETPELQAALPMLRAAEALARVLNRQRQERGSLDFDLPEAEFQFTEDGSVASMGLAKRTFAHRIIEECMIAANEAVARFLTGRREPFLYRVHPAPEPEKLLGLFSLLRNTGIADAPARQVSGAWDADAALAALHEVLRVAERDGGTTRYIINRLVLRTMMQARYAQEHEGHFGLASACYCHFTSPIRRYADLAVHRALKHALGVPGYPGLVPAYDLKDVADTLNTHERTAQDAEREIRKRLTVLFLSGRVGETFSGTISGITDFGIFVELDASLAEGMIRVAAMTDDYYIYLPERQELIGQRSGQRFAMGQEIRVRLESVSLDRLEITFVPEGDRTPKKMRAALSRRGRTDKRRAEAGASRAPGARGRATAGKGAGKRRAGKGVSKARPDARGEA